MNDKTKLAELNPDWLPGAKAFIGVTMGAIVIRWGPYEPEQIGQFMTRLHEADPDRKIPFFAGIQCDPLDDPVESILNMGWVSKEECARQLDEIEQEEREHNGGFTIAEEQAQEDPDNG